VIALAERDAPVQTARVSVRNLCKRFTIGTGRATKRIEAVSDVSFDIAAGETLAVVGESGCGKTTLGRMLALLLPPSSGTLSFDDRPVRGWRRRDLRPLRRHVQMVFQDPVSSLNPRHTVRNILIEPMQNFRIGSAAERHERAVALLEAVGLAPTDLKRYPHEFSGGQRQRITLARALALNPDLIVADEPVSALDVSVQSQILNLLADLRDRHELTYLFISHDLSVVHHLADRVAVMYLGRIVELGSRDAIYDRPGHPYTRALLASVPSITPHKQRMGQILQGDPPSPAEPPSGCHFHPRCPHASQRCRTEQPALEPQRDNSMNAHLIACHHKAELA
jgi:oligopeptide/dipeptide ABC transporter ATP-binding protein